MDNTATNRVFSILFVLLFIESIGLAFLHNTFLEAIMIGLPTLSLCLYLLKTSPQSALSKHVAGLGSMVFAFLHIHQANGLIEVHFEIFILLAFLIMFRDWRVFVSATLLVAVHHLSFYFLQSNNTGVYIFDDDRLKFTTVIIHAVYAIVEATIAAYIAKQMYEESRVGEELIHTTEAISSAPNELNLKMRTQCGTSDVLSMFNLLLDAIDSSIREVKVETSSLHQNSKALLIAKQELEESSSARQLETDNIASSTEEMATTVASISQETTILSEQMKQANNSTRSMLRDINIINDKNDELSNALVKTSSDVDELSNSTDEINVLLDDITGIADQTNLLALNAAIEAARAGEQGRGFAVVADEVRALANRTKSSTDKISETLTRLSSYSKVTLSSMETCLEASASVKSVTVNTTDHIKEASSIVESASEIAETVAAAVEEQSSTTNGIATSIETLRVTAYEDIDKINSLSREAILVETGAQKMDESVAKFK